MTTPEGSPHGNPAEGADGSAWGRPPAGGWGDPSRDPGGETRSWSEDAPAPEDERTRADLPREDPDATRLEQPGVWGPPSGAGPDEPRPAWAQQPPPGGGWNAPPPDGFAQQGGQPGWGPTQAHPGQGPYGPPQPYPGRPYPGGPYPGQQGPGPYPGQPYPGAEYPGPGQAPYPGAGPHWAGGPQAPQWGQGYPPLPDVSRAPRRSRTPLLVGGVVVALLAVGAVLAFVAPGFLNTTVFDQAALQSGVQRVLVEDYGYPTVGEVTCGDPAQGPIRVTAGASFTCSTTIDGAPAVVPVTITSGGGDYEVSRPDA